jgi:uncharacterized protein (TIGR03437 family)
LLALAVCSAGQAQTVRITWVGQSCFVVQNTEGTPVVVTDPPSVSTGYPLPTVPADVVTVSHNHSDHNYTAGIRGTFTLVDGRTITGRQETTAAGLPFVLIPSWHDNQGGTQRGANAIIRWTQAGVRFAHLGDFGEDQFSEAQAAALRDVDVLFIPAGGFYTIDAARAATFVTQLKPRVAILMHFRTALGGPAQLATFPAVIQPSPEVRYKPASVVVGRSTLPQTTEVWLMEPAAPVVAVNAAGFSAGMPVAPGSLVALFGEFTGSETLAASSVPLSRRLGETEVLIGGAAVPLLYVSPTQINLQLSSRADTGQAVLEVRVASKAVARGSLTVIPTAPGVFAAVGPDARLNSARCGQPLVIYASGQGDVSPAVADGAPAPAQPLAVTPLRPDVVIGYQRAQVTFSGLAPGWIGLWQLNVTVPANVPSGSGVPVVVNQGITSNTLWIEVGGCSPACANCPTCTGC